MRVLIAGDRPLPATVGDLVNNALVVGADGGGDRLLAAGVEPDAVVGDLDSLSVVAQKQFSDRLVRDTNPATSDLEMYIGNEPDSALELWVGEIERYCAGIEAMR